MDIGFCPGVLNYVHDLSRCPCPWNYFSNSLMFPRRLKPGCQDLLEELHVFSVQ